MKTIEKLSSSNSGSPYPSRHGYMMTFSHSCPMHPPCIPVGPTTHIPTRTMPPYPARAPTHIYLRRCRRRGETALHSRVGGLLRQRRPTPWRASLLPWPVAAGPAAHAARRGTPHRCRRAGGVAKVGIHRLAAHAARQDAPRCSRCAERSSSRDRLLLVPRLTRHAEVHHTTIDVWGGVAEVGIRRPVAHVARRGAPRRHR